VVSTKAGWVVIPPFLDAASASTGATVRARARARAARFQERLARSGRPARVVDVEMEVATIGDLRNLDGAARGGDAWLLPGGAPRVRRALLKALAELGFRARELDAAQLPEEPGGELPAAGDAAPASALDRRATALEARWSGWGIEDVFLEESLTWTHELMFRNLR